MCTFGSETDRISDLGQTKTKELHTGDVDYVERILDVDKGH